MKKILKPFAAWATGLRSDLFAWARIKLTALYLLIITGTLTVYSFAMYYSVLVHVRTDAAVDYIQLQIIVIDAATFIIAALGSYWLAGVTLRPIKRALESQEAFSADASHELRTPLAVMKTDIEVMLRGKEMLTENVKNVLKSNLEEITILTSMTGELLELSRGRHKAQEKVSIGPLLRQEVEKLQTLAASKGIELTLESTGDASVIASKEGLIHVFKNVIANAIAYTASGGKISVSMVETRQKAVITVVDNGIGISEQDLAHVFERFYKGGAGRGGSGLGLAIAKQIIGQCRGTIAIASAVSQGTIVTISLPLQV